MKVFQRDYSNFDKQALVTDIQSINWDVLLRDVYEPSSMFDSFYNKISEVIDTHIPIKQLSRQELIRILVSLRNAPLRDDPKNGRVADYWNQDLY